MICRTYYEKYEVREVLGVKLPKGILVVNATSAEPNIPGEIAVPLDGDHLSVCKPANEGAQLYMSVKAFLKECLNP
ncbi:MAG TPA: hypothetical protein VKD72_09575 [Gemmataceae bacterium]|nr:hypothetical protein [Gemmataceae bacterium]